MTGPVFENSGATQSEARKEERERGRPEHEPSQAERGMVTLLAAYKMPLYRIADALRLSLPTLKKHYQHELENAETIVDAEVLLAWMKLIKKGDSMTVNRYMERKFRAIEENATPPALPNVTLIDDVPKLENNVPEIN